MACSLVLMYFYSSQLGIKTLDYRSRDMLNFDFLEKSLEIVSLPHFVYDFSRKMFLTSYSVNWSNFIIWFSLLLAFVC